MRRLFICVKIFSYSFYFLANSDGDVVPRSFYTFFEFLNKIDKSLLYFQLDISSHETKISESQTEEALRLQN